MNSPLLRAVCVVMILCYISACASATSRQAVGVHTAAEGSDIRIKENEVYVIVFSDGTEVRAEGSTLMLRDSSIYAYSSEEESWKRYPLSDIDEVYVEKTDHQKKNNRAALITGAAVITAFVAAAAGSYFIEREMR